MLHEPKIPGSPCLVNLRVLKIPAFFVLHGGTNPLNFQHSCVLRTFLDLKIQHFVLREPQIYQMSSILCFDNLTSPTCFCFRGGTPVLWLRENGTICPFGVFPCVEAIFCPIWGQSLWWGQLWSCWFFPCFVGISAVYGCCPNSPCPFRHPLCPFYTPKPLRLRFKGKCPILRKKRQNLGKKAKDKWFHFHACTSQYAHILQHFCAPGTHTTLKIPRFAMCIFGTWVTQHCYRLIRICGPPTPQNTPQMLVCNWCGREFCVTLQTFSV